MTHPSPTRRSSDPTDSDAGTIGSAPRSEISHDLEGTVDFSMPASVAVVLGANPAYADGDIYAPFDTPSTDTVSLRVDVSDQFRILADAQLTGWTSLKSVDIYRDNGNVEIGRASCREGVCQYV